MKQYELKAIYDSRAGFYGKAQVIEQGDTLTLKSYDTKILQFDKKTKAIKFLTHNSNHFTLTTNRHINEFLQQFTNILPMTKSELLKLANA